ncbi:hypothetical protein [Photobacterium sp. Hal280]|uniref:hypothetical protein n=1 Tax=Photobacterium sp. Hal280 TaxID=3035163 RepID=UPI00301D2FF8
MRYELMESHRLSLSDLHRVLSPDSARWRIQVEHSIKIKGLDGLPLRDRNSRDDILRKIQSGELVLLGDSGDLYDASGHLKSNLPFGFSSRMRVLQKTARPTRYVKAHYAPFDPDTNMYETVAEVATRVVGASKQFVNDFVRHQAAQMGEHFAEEGVFVTTDTQTGQVLTPEAVSQAYIDSAHEMFPIEGKLEQQGAETLKGYESYQAMVPIVSLAAGGYKGMFKLAKDPKLLSDLLEAALRDARSLPEALGQLGMEHAKQRLGITNHPDYINRYHGPDCVGCDVAGNLVEIESKGTAGATKAVSLNVDQMKQWSAAKNLKRAQQMIGKVNKIGQPSARQGGEYTDGEIDLWENIEMRSGEKRHLLVNTDTVSGRVRVYEQDEKGNIIEQVDDFVIEHYSETKAFLESLF